MYLFLKKKGTHNLGQYRNWIISLHLLGHCEVKGRQCFVVFGSFVEGDRWWTTAGFPGCSALVRTVLVQNFPSALSLCQTTYFPHPPAITNRLVLFSIASPQAFLFITKISVLWYGEVNKFKSLVSNLISNYTWPLPKTSKIPPQLKSNRSPELL